MGRKLFDTPIILFLTISFSLLVYLSMSRFLDVFTVRSAENIFYFMVGILVFAINFYLIRIVYAFIKDYMAIDLSSVYDLDYDIDEIHQEDLDEFI